MKRWKLKETELKYKLFDLLTKHCTPENGLRVKKELKVKSFHGNTIKPDISFFIGGNLFHIECKDDNAKTFNLSDLMSQAISYWYSEIKGFKPALVFIATTKLLSKGKSPYMSEIKMSQIGQAGKSGIGICYYNESHNEIWFAMSGNIVFKISDSKFEYFPNKIPKLYEGSRKGGSKHEGINKRMA